MKTKIVLVATDNKTLPKNIDKVCIEDVTKEMFDIFILSQLRDKADPSDDFKISVESVDIIDE